MAHHIERLKNGIKLIHKEVASPISHFGILLNTGTRDELPTTPGLAHFVEHTIFKGTEKRTANQVIQRMENVGGDLNASTSKEETYFHTSFLNADCQRAIELLADIFYNATFPEKELEKEKDVILEEIHYYHDTPVELIFDDFETLIYQKHPLGRNILGDKKSLKRLSRNDILEFISNHYTLENIVLSYIGNLPLKRVKQYCENHFGNRSISSKKQMRTPFSGYQKQFIEKHKNTAQAHVIFGNLAYALDNDKRYPLLLLTNLLGGQGLNTRLNLAIREKRGWAYSVEANYTPFSDSGLLSFYIGCDSSMVDKCIEVAHREIDKVKKNRLGTMQLHYAIKQFLGQLAISNEAKLNEMIAMGRSALFYDEVETLEESVAIFEKITSEQILEVANEILDIEQFSTLIFRK